MTQNPAIAAGLIHLSAALSRPRLGPEAATAGHQVFFVGQSTGNGNTADLYDAATGRWSTVRMPGEGNTTVAASFGGLALFVQSSGVVEIYHARTGRFSSARLSQARAGPAVAIVGDQVVFAGGVIFGPTGGMIASDAVDIYNGATGRWSTATLSSARGGIAVATVGDLALFAGGVGTGLQSDAVDIYDAATGRWSTATLSQARNGIAATAVGSKVIFAGGFFADPGGIGHESAAVDIYDASSGRWSAGALSEARGGIAATAVGNLALFAGGDNGLAGSDLVDIYNGVTGQWSTARLSRGRFDVSAATLGPDAVFVGGESGSRGTADIFDTRTGQWSTAALTVARENPTAIAIGTTALFAGGFVNAPSSQQPTAAVDLFTIPSLIGSVSRPQRGTVLVTLSDIGASALPAPDSVAVYASKNGSLDGAALLGSIRVRGPLAAGASEDVSVPISIPVGLAPGQYHLIAAAGPPHQLTLFASQRRTFTVGPAATGATAAAIPLTLPRSVVFTTGPAIGDSIFNDSKDPFDGTARP